MKNNLLGKALVKTAILRTAPLFIMCLILFSHRQASALSTPHHLYNISRRLCEVAGAPIYGVFIQGPKNIKKAYTSEVWEQEKQKNRGLLRYKLFALWRAPGEELKGVIKGLTDSVSSLGQACTEFISIFFGD